MPNQLSKSKRRLSVAEHNAVLEAVEAISRFEGTTVVALVREAIRELVKKRAAQPANAEMLRAAVWKLAPRRVSRVRTHAQLARFKQEQREFDKVVLELQLASPSEIEAHNSIAHPDEPIHMTANNPDFAVQMNVAESLSRRYRNALSELAK